MAKYQCPGRTICYKVLVVIVLKHETQSSPVTSTALCHIQSTHMQMFSLKKQSLSWHFHFTSFSVNDRICLDFSQHLYIPTENADRNWWEAIVWGIRWKKQNVYRKDSSSNSVKDHLAHCAHGRTPNELQSVPEVKNSNYYGSEKMKTISMRWS